MKHEGNLIITIDNASDFSELVEVTGYLYIYADTQLPKLTTVGGSLHINADAQLPKLTTVGGYLDIGADTQLPELTTVGDYLYIYADAQLPELTTVGGSLTIHADAQLPELTKAHGKVGKLICVSDYGLWASEDGKFSAGCRKDFTKEKALEHWYREDERARKFTAAILAI